MTHNFVIRLWRVLHQSVLNSLRSIVIGSRSLPRHVVTSNCPYIQVVHNLELLHNVREWWDYKHRQLCMATQIQNCKATSTLLNNLFLSCYQFFYVPNKISLSLYINVHFIFNHLYGNSVSSHVFHWAGDNINDTSLNHHAAPDGCWCRDICYWTNPECFDLLHHAT